MNLFAIAVVGLLISVVLFAIYWVVQRWLNNAGIVDVFWGPSVAVVGVYFCIATAGDVTRRWVGAALISVWAIRLGWHLFLRWNSHDEDARYANLKTEWGDQAQFRMFRFYQMQGLGCFLFAMTLLATGSNGAPFGWFDWIGVLIWLTSIVGESVADHQLAEFRKRPENKGEVCRVGLWKFSRHPNYFFEWLHWWTYVMFSITAPWGWLTLIAPVAMWHFLTRVTGIPLSEAQSLKSRGQKYREYQSTTNAFFPWFPKPT